MSDAPQVPAHANVVVFFSFRYNFFVCRLNFLGGHVRKMLLVYAFLNAIVHFCAFGMKKVIADQSRVPI